MTTGLCVILVIIGLIILALAIFIFRMRGIVYHSHLRRYVDTKESYELDLEEAGLAPVILEVIGDRLADKDDDLEMHPVFLAGKSLGTIGNLEKDGRVLIVTLSGLKNLAEDPQYAGLDARLRVLPESLTKIEEEEK